MEWILNTRLMLAAHLCVIVLVIIGGAWAYHAATNEFEAAVRANIQRQLDILETLAVTTDRNGVDGVVAGIIADCPNRQQFEELLGELGTLRRNELIVAQQLFDSCGSFYAERKAVMVSKLEREFEVLQDNIALLLTLDDTEEKMTKIENAWGQVVVLEKERSAFLDEQVEIQRDIITELISGRNIYSTAITEKTTRAQEVAELLSVVGSRIDVLREEAINL